MPQTKIFKQLLKSTEDTYLGKPVKKKYQSKYGKFYDKKETKSVAYAIANKLNIKIEKGGAK
jgi:hypothetical protein